MAGILERAIEDFEKSVINNRGCVKLDAIVDFITTLQRHEYDAHIAVMGQNGNGKSLLMLALMKKILERKNKKNFLDNILYAHNTTSEFISLLKKLKDSVVGIDEGKKFFHYKLSMTTEQIVLTNMLEYTRCNRNAVIVCTNDVRRLNNNYRNSKIQMVIWLLDRFHEGKIKCYGLVFLGNPALEEEDKFCLNRFENLHTFESIRLIAESLQSFYGYFVLDDILNYITREELKKYHAEKMLGIKATAEAYMRKLEKKENTSNRQREKKFSVFSS